jgi:Taurine catabolism dioxygenase TauD, TfdA family
MHSFYKPLAASGEAAGLEPDEGPFSLKDEKAYAAWREAKLAAYPKTAAELRIPVANLTQPSPAERGQLLSLCARANMALYDAGELGRDALRVRPALRALADSLNMQHVEDHRSGEADGIVAIEVASEGGRAGYIPYSTRPISWHTDGYYNYHGPSRSVQAMVLHCVRDAPEGGVNSLLDQDIAYIRLRDRDPAFIAALMHPEAMTIPAGEEAGGRPRPDNTGPVFFVDPATGALVMRYTARKRYVSWRADVTTRRALAALEEVLQTDPLIFTYKMQPGEGMVCNNVLHTRTGFDNCGATAGRLLYRVRYYGRVGAC